MASATQIALCFSDKNLAKQTAEATEGLEAQANLRFSSDKDFTHWLFRQPRGAVAPSLVLVVGWREAKLCMAAIKAARTGETDRLRPDKTRPTLVEAAPRGLLHVNVTVGAMVVLTTKAEQRDKAIEWTRSGECDGFVAVGVASGPCDVEACLRVLCGPQQQPHQLQARRQQLQQQHRQQQQQLQQRTLPTLLQQLQCAPAEPSVSRQRSSRLGQWADAQPDISRARASRLRSPSPNYAWPGFANAAAAAPSFPRRLSLTLTRHEKVADSCHSSSPSPHLVGHSCRMSDASEAADGRLTATPSSPRGRPASLGSDRSLEDDAASGTRSPSPEYMWRGFSRRGVVEADKAHAEWPPFPGSTVGFQCASDAH